MAFAYCPNISPQNSSPTLAVVPGPPHPWQMTQKDTPCSPPSKKCSNCHIWSALITLVIASYLDCQEAEEESNLGFHLLPRSPVPDKFNCSKKIAAQMRRKTFFADVVVAILFHWKVADCEVSCNFLIPYFAMKRRSSAR